MKIIVCISHARSRKQASRVLNEVAKEIATGHGTSAMGHIPCAGDYTYDFIKGNPDLVVSEHPFTL